MDEQEQLEQMEEEARKNRNKKIAKDAARKTAKLAGRAAKKLISAIIKGIGAKGILLIAAGLAIIILLALFWYALTTSTFNAFSDITSGETGQGQISQITSISDGQISIDSEELTTNMDEWLRINRVSREQLGISEDYREIINLLEAEAMTTYPDLRQRNLIGTETQEGELQGCVQFHRKYSNGTSEVLEYMEYDEFAVELAKLGVLLDEEQTQEQIYFSKAEVETAYNNLKDNFTLDEDNNLIVISMFSTETNDRYSDYAKEEGKQDGSEYNYTFSIQVKRANYQSIISKYSMPCELGIAFLITTQNSGFCEAIADLAKDSKIIIDVQDNLTTIQSEEVYGYTADFNIYRYIRYYTEEEIEEEVKEETGLTKDKNKDATKNIVTKQKKIVRTDHTYNPYPIEEHQTINVEAYKTVNSITQSNDIKLCVSQVNMWFADYDSVYTNIPETTQENGSYSDDDDEGYHSVENYHHFEPSANIPYGAHITEDTTKVEELQTNKITVSTTIITKNNYNKTSSEITEAPEKFLSLLKINPNTGEFDTENLRNNTQTIKYKIINSSRQVSPENNLLTSEAVLYQLLRSNGKTVDLEEIVKYLIDIYRGRVKAGESGLDFSIYEPGMFYDATNRYYGNDIKEKVWFALKELGYSDYAVAGAMGNIDYESAGFSTTAVEGGSGEGIGLCQWSFGRRRQLETYAASKGVVWQDEDTQVEFLIAEISGQGPAAGYASQRVAGYIGNENITSTRSDWENAGSINDATLFFMRFFESPQSRSSLDARIQRALNYYNEFKDREPPIFINITLTGENRNIMINMIREAIRIAEDDRYQYSQTNRNSEFFYDCSSFVSRLYESFFGISRLDSSGPNSRGTDNIRSACSSNRVSMTSLQPGDILWRDGHVALYIGDSQVAEAKGTQWGIVISTITLTSYTEAYRLVT